MSDRPKMTDLSWTDYVIGQLDESELFEGCPTVDGLRRVAELLIGPILESHATVVDVARNIVSCRIVIDDKEETRVVTELAEVNAHNTVEAFLPFAVSVAATRAEGRALRKLLKLRKVIAAEEAGDPVVGNTDNKISGNQISAIKALCGRLKIDVNKFINSGSGKYMDLSDVEYAKAVKMVDRLNQYQQNKVEVPAGILKE